MELVRPAGPGDRDRCRELLDAARREAGSARGGDLLASLADVDGGEADAGPADGRLVLVGLFAGVVVGLASGRLSPWPLPEGRRLGQVDCCYVEPGARGVGVGSALVEGILAWLAARGCTDVDARALPGDRSTKQLYETAGFKARLLVLHRRLD